MDADIKRAQEVQTLPSQWRLNVTNEGGRLSIRKENASLDLKLWAHVSKESSAILVKEANKEKPPTELIPFLNEKGECRLLYEGKELEFWQASRLILEPLLF